MSTSRRILLSTLAQGLGKIIAVAIGLLTLNLLTQYLDERGFGQYSTVIAFLGFFAVLADFGLYLIVAKEISKSGDDASSTISNALGLRLTASTALLLLGTMLAWILPYEQVVKETMLVGVAAFTFVSISQVLMGIFQKHLVTHLPAASELFGRILNLLLVFWFIRQGLSLPFFIIALVVANGLVFFTTLWFAKKYERFGLAFKFSVWKKLLVAGWPLAFAVILNLLYFKTDTIILSLFRPAEDGGVYGLPYKILEVLLAFPAMFVGLYFPLLSKSAFGSWEEFGQIIQRAFNSLLLITAPMVITTWFFAEPIINLIKGPRQYTDSASLLKILIVATAIIFLGTLFGYAVTAVNRQKTMVWGYLFGAVIGLLLYFILIPRYGYFGAAYSTVLVELLVAAWAYRLVAKESKYSISWTLLARIAPAAGVLAILFYLIDLWWVEEVLIGLVCYFFTLLATKAIRWSTVRELIS